MAKRLGVICIILGALCMLSALTLVLYNRQEVAHATEDSQVLLEKVQILMEKTSSTEDISQPSEEVPAVDSVPIIMPMAEMETISVDGYDCIGILSIPALELELPVLTDWSYTKLKKAPCLYHGSYYEENFVIAAHNYTAHFGKLSLLRQGDLVIFTDVKGNAYCYEVVLLETLPATATEEMITSGFDLSLYTCTLGGANRITVRCQKLAG